MHFGRHTKYIRTAAKYMPKRAQVLTAMCYDSSQFNHSKFVFIMYIINSMRVITY